jgi:hypothetical protein
MTVEIFEMQMLLVFLICLISGDIRTGRSLVMALFKYFVKILLWFGYGYRIAQRFMFWRGSFQRSNERLVEPLRGAT